MPLSPEALAAAALGIAPAEERALRATLDVPGHIRLDPTKEAQVGARTGGQLDAIRVRTEAELAVASGEIEAAEERLRILGVDPTRINPSKGEHFPSHFRIRAPIAEPVTGGPYVANAVHRRARRK